MVDTKLVDYCTVGPPQSLRSFTDGLHDHSFPLFACIRKKGITMRRSQHLVYLHQKKRIPFAWCVSDKDQSAYAIPVGKESGIRLLPATRSSNSACILPSELLACKTPPNIVCVSKSFVASAKGKDSGTVMLREGTLLFPQEIKHKKKSNVSLLVKTDTGVEVAINLKCTGRFSVSFGPEFDLLHILKTFKETVKLPMDVSICRRVATEPESMIKLLRVGEDWALCGIMTNELAEETGKVQFRYKAELLASLPYTVQRMVPIDSNSPTALQLKASYDKAVTSKEEESVYDDPALAIYETVEEILMPNPAYDSCGDGGAATSSGNDMCTEYVNSPSVICKEQMPKASWRDGAATYSEMSSSKAAVMWKLPEAPTQGHVPQKDSESPHVSRVVNASSHPAMKIPSATYSPTLKKLSLVQHQKFQEFQERSLTSPDRNVEFLKSLDIDMVQRLLSAMNLSQHKERFQAEQVDGEILACCDVEVLQELGVTSRVQQIRLTKIIDGTHSAAALLNK